MIIERLCREHRNIEMLLAVLEHELNQPAPDVVGRAGVVGSGDASLTLTLFISPAQGAHFSVVDLR